MFMALVEGGGPQGAQKFSESFPKPLVYLVHFKVKQTLKTFETHENLLVHVHIFKLVQR